MGIDNTHIIYYLGWRVNNNIYIDDSIDGNSVEFVEAVKLFGLTHYCIITPPMEGQE